MSKITEEEIIDFYKTNYEIGIRKEDLARPTKDFVTNLFLRILEKLDIFNLNQPDILACTNVNQNMENAYLIINIYTVLNKFLMTIGLNDFKITDILMPKRSRNNLILHAMANYYVRYNTVKVEFLEHAKIYSELYQTKKDLMKNKKELQHLIEEKSMLLSSVKNKSIGQDKELKSLEEVFNNVKQDVEKEEKIVAEIKTENIALREKLCDIKLEICQATENKKKLTESIIESPQRIIENKNDLEKKLEHLKNETQRLKLEQKELYEKKSHHLNFYTFISDTMKEIKELLDLQSKNEKQGFELEEVVKNTNEQMEQIKQFEVEKKDKVNSIQRIKTMISKENVKYEREKQVLTELMSGLKEKCKNFEQMKSKLSSSESAQQTQLAKLNDELNELNKMADEFQQRQMETHKMKLKKLYSMLVESAKLKDYPN